MKNSIRDDLFKIVADNKAHNGENTSLYDYIANNYYKMSKEELKELILNLDYAMCHNLGRNLYLDLETQALRDTLERIGD